MPPSVRGNSRKSDASFHARRGNLASLNLGHYHHKYELQDAGESIEHTEKILTDDVLAPIEK
jgi:hypothetical protein